MSKELTGLDSYISIGLAGDSSADRSDGDFANNHLRTPIVMVVCVDDEISNNLILLKYFQKHAEMRRPVIPLILPRSQAEKFCT